MKLSILGICAVCVSALTFPAVADSDDHDRALKAVRAGEIMPLEQVLSQARKVSPGKVLKVELEREGGMWVYEIKLLRENGVLSKQYFDAKTGALLQGKPRGRFGGWDDDDDWDD